MAAVITRLLEYYLSSSDPSNRVQTNLKYCSGFKYYSLCHRVKSQNNEPSIINNVTDTREKKKLPISADPKMHQAACQTQLCQQISA